MMREEAYVHFRKEERPFVERMVGWIEQVIKTSTPRQTDFLDPRQLFILQTIVNRYPELDMVVYGGYDSAERKKALVSPSFIPSSRNDIELSVLLVEADQRFHQLTHGDYLGALLNIGLKREKFGDVLVQSGGAQIFVATDVAQYVVVNLQQVHRQSVKVKEIGLHEVRFDEQEMNELTFTVASLRLDAVVSDAYHISRSKVVPLIRGGKCKVNWVVTEDPSVHVKEGDTLSLQGYGRCILFELDGVTKKGRYRVKVGRYV